MIDWIDWMVFYTIFNSISVISQLPVHPSMLSWSSFNQYSAQYSFQATGCFPILPLWKQRTVVREEWILLQWLSSILRKNIGLAEDRTGNLLFSSLQHYRLSYVLANRKDQVNACQKSLVFLQTVENTAEKSKCSFKRSGKRIKCCLEALSVFTQFFFFTSLNLLPDDKILASSNWKDLLMTKGRNHEEKEEMLFTIIFATS